MINTALSLANFTAAGTAAVYTYSGADLTRIAGGPPVVLSSNTVKYGFPAYSATLFIFDSTN
jgi:hypothetical protein